MRSLDICERQLRSAHSHADSSLNNLAELYREQGKYSEAEPLYRRSLSILERQLGSEHPDVELSLFNLAVLYHNMKRYSEALNLIQRAIQIFEETLGSDHPNTKAAQSWLAPIKEKGKGKKGKRRIWDSRSLMLAWDYCYISLIVFVIDGLRLVGLK